MTDAHIQSPYEPALHAAVEQLYVVFGEGPLSAQLETCACPVCMDEATRQRIIETPTRQLSEELIVEYSNSAHGVPDNLSDLRALLPRYLDLIAQDKMVDHNGVGAELSRFGDALREDETFYTSLQQAALQAWARAAIGHFGYAEAQDQDNLHTASDLLEMLLAGGWPVADLTAVMNDLFTDPEIGPRALGQFARAAVALLIETAEGTGLDWFGLRYADDAALQGLANWLNSKGFQLQLAHLAAATDASESDQTAAAALLNASGTFTISAFPHDRSA